MNISKAAFAAMICGMVLTACNNDDDITENKGTAQPDDTPKDSSVLPLDHTIGKLPVLLNIYASKRHNHRALEKRTVGR